MMKGSNDKLKFPARGQRSIPNNNDLQRKSRRKVWLRLAAIFLIIVFLASECATLLPLK
jgi:hypothetical protein